MTKVLVLDVAGQTARSVIAMLVGSKNLELMLYLTHARKLNGKVPDCWKRWRTPGEHNGQRTTPEEASTLVPTMKLTLLISNLPLGNASAVIPKNACCL